MKTLPYVAGLATGLAIGLALAGALIPAQKPPAQKPSARLKDNATLTRMYAEDQGDRQGAIDWAKVGPRDAARRKATLAAYRAGEVRTGNDYVRAAMVLQHGEGDDQLLAHEMCVAALAVGGVGKTERSLAAWLAAASEDRWLDHLGRRQRFGTQYKSKALPSGKLDKTRLVPVEEPGVTDAHRKAMGCPTLAGARAREAEFDRR